MQDLIARRRLDGSIDIDFYRQRGLTERRVVMARFFKGLIKLGRPLAAVAVMIFAISMMPSRDGTGWNGLVADGGAPMSASLTNAATTTR
jgi:hypothetical protein